MAGPAEHGVGGEAMRREGFGGWAGVDQPLKPLPPRRLHLVLQGRPLLVLPQGHHQIRARLPQPMRPKFLDCLAPRVGLPASRPPRATLKPGDCDCQCVSVRDQSGCRAALGAPPASPVPACGGPGLPLRGTCGCVEGNGSPTGPPRVVAVGSLSQGQGSARMQLGMPVELSSGG